MKQYQRILTLAAATVAGLAGSLAIAGTANASDTSPYEIEITAGEYTCLPDGGRLVTWNVENARVSGAATVTAVTAKPDGSTVDLAVGATIPGDGDVNVTQIVPAGATSASLKVAAEWPAPNADSAKPKDEKTGTIEEFEGTCTPKYTVTQDCAGITFTFPAMPPAAEAKLPGIDVSLTPSTGDKQEFQRNLGDPEKTVTFTGTPGLTVELSYGRDFKKTYAWTPEGCPVPDLPTTGSSLTGPAAIGGGLLVAGIALIAGLFMFRRRRTVAGS